MDSVGSCKYKRIGQKSESRINPFIEATIMGYLSHPGYYSANSIKRWVNLSIEEFNTKHGAQFRTISKSTVAQYSSDYRNEINYYREGKKRFDTATRPFMPRITALNAGSLAQMDGSPVQFICWNHPSKWDKDGKRQIRMNLYVMRDAYSGKITGFDMSENEDRFNVIETIKMSVNLNGHLPAEIVHDNGSATKTDEFKAIKSQLESRGVLVRAAKVGNAQDKGEVERFFGTFQSRFQRLVDGYLGEGIRSKRANGRISEEFIKKFHKESGIYGYDEMQLIIAQLIVIYNASEINDKYKDNTPNKLYAESEKPFVVPVDAFDFARMFWLNKEVTVRKSMIINEVRKSKRFYEIWDNAHKLQLNGQTVRIYYEENEASEIHVYSASGAFVCTCKQKSQIHEAFVDRQDGDVERIIKHVSHCDAIYGHVEIKANERVKNAEQFTGQPFELQHAFTLEKSKLNEGESQLYITQYYDKKDIVQENIPERKLTIPETPYSDRERLEKLDKPRQKGIRVKAATLGKV
jgi:transposase InsO family protein